MIADQLNSLASNGKKDFRSCYYAAREGYTYELDEAAGLLIPCRGSKWTKYGSERLLRLFLDPADHPYCFSHECGQVPGIP
jgi:hypothetical protein